MNMNAAMVSSFSYYEAHRHLLIHVFGTRGLQLSASRDGRSSRSPGVYGVLFGRCTGPSTLAKSSQSNISEGKEVQSPKVKRCSFPKP